MRDALGIPYQSGRNPISRFGPTLTRGLHVPGVTRVNHVVNHSLVGTQTYKCCSECRDDWRDFRAFPTFCGREPLFEFGREEAVESLLPTEEAMG